MADTNAKWDFTLLSDAEQKAYIDNAKAKGFEVDETTGIITGIPEMEEIKPVTCNIVSASPSKTIVNNKPSEAVLFGLDCEVQYFDRETLTFKPTSMVRVNQSLQTKLIEVGLGGIIKSEVIEMEELKDLVLPKLNNIPAEITVRMNKTDEYGYGSSAIVKLKPNPELVKSVMQEIKDMLELKQMMANINGNDKPIV